MKSTDALLLAPAAICAAGAVVYVATDARTSAVFLSVAILSLAALVLHWLLRRARR